MARARAIADLLAGFGLPANKMDVQNKSEYEPIADNDTERGRAKNRRVEIIINQ